MYDKGYTLTKFFSFLLCLPIFVTSCKTICKFLSLQNMIIQRHLEGNSLSLSTWSVMEPQGATESEDEAQDDKGQRTKDKGQSSRTELPPSPQTSNYPTVRMPSSTSEMGGLFRIKWAERI